MIMTDILSLTIEELTDLLPEFPKFRAKQVFEWLHKHKAVCFDEMTVLPSNMQSALSERFHIKSLTVKKTLTSSKKDTQKYLYKLEDGHRIETVFMSHKHGNSLCISSQVGCRMGCSFCASGLTGLERNLTPSEMLLQVYESERQGKTVNSIVIMGVGEPLDNYENVLRFLELLQKGHGMSLRHVSLSTCGLVPKINELSKLKLGLTLSVSLHAANDKTRSEIMPINKKYNLDMLLHSCGDYFKATGRRISFEYALISGENDSEGHAEQLVSLLSRMPSGSYHVNLIPVNEISELKYKRSINSKEFLQTLLKHKVNATIRRTMGADIEAACGQLRKGASAKKLRGL
jgi:23S rRNA (adenine2503-C2)-methyltransferase